ncbi:MAG: hypothetical protein NTY20_02805 [Candidatus Aenigmarchaeota archaeon]|nr:hypothetical protein [Candidatus Aenigmarchaeota archaeon]
MLLKKPIKREPYDREGLKTIADILISGGEIPYTHGGKEYELQIICGVPEWLDMKASQIASCKTQNEIYIKHDTNQDEFWKFFDQTKKDISNSQNSYRRAIEKGKEKNDTRIRELLKLLKDSNISPKEILQGYIDVLKVYALLPRNKSLFKEYSRGHLALKEIESDIEYAKKHKKDFFVIKGKGVTE